MTPDPQETTLATPVVARIHVRRLTTLLLLTLVAPIAVAVLIDVTARTMPVLTIAVSLICIPLATIIVNRAVLSEMDRIVDLVAPAPPVESSGLGPDEEVGNQMPDATTQP